MIKAIKKNEALVAEIDSLAQAPGFHLWWLGQSGYLLQWQGRRLLLDPYLSDSLTQKYLHTDKPHTRMSELVIQPHLLQSIHVITSSHNHTDHLDAATLQPILQNNPSASLLIPAANRNFVAERLGCHPTMPAGISDGESITLQGFTFYGLPASHNQIERDENGHCKYMGYVIAFGPYHIYHSGDTLWFDGMEDILKKYPIDVALLPINGNKPERRVAGNLDAAEAAALAKAIGAKRVIPCHYDMFTFNTANVDDFIKAAEHLKQSYVVLKPGGRYTQH
jgi:L-ascorbate metabolism protein UlaG (beta-lactamase superfamily)